MKYIVAVYFEINSEEEFAALKHWLDNNCRFPTVFDEMTEGTAVEVKSFLEEGHLPKTRGKGKK